MKAFKILLIFLFTVYLSFSCAMELNVTEAELNDPDLLLDKGRYYYSLEEYDLAIQVFEMVLERYPNRAYNASWAQYEIGMCHYLEKDYDEAREAFVKVWRKYPIPKQPRRLAIYLIRKIDRGDEYKRSSYRD